MKIAFRVDASQKIGTGHVMRCLSLAETLKACGVESQFICRNHPANLIEMIREKGFEVYVLENFSQKTRPITSDVSSLAHSHWLGCDWREDAQQTERVLKRLNPNWLVVDHYALDAEWERALKPYCGRLMVIDDLADRTHACDLLLDQTLGRSAQEYAPLMEPDTKTLVGNRYILLREEFSRCRPSALMRRKSTARPRQLLINTGGIDSQGHTLHILKCVQQSRWEGEITVVMGSQSSSLAGVETFCEKYPNMSLQVDVKDMAPLLSRMDFAIGAAGTSAWERCAVGLPTLLVQSAENQRFVARALNDHGAAIFLGMIDTINSTHISKALEQLKTHYHEMCERSAEICDGFGCIRVLMAVVGSQAQVGTHGAALKPVDIADKRYLYYLQTRKNVRRWFSEPKVPSWSEHGVWFSRNWNHPDINISIAYYDGEAVGMIRFDRRTADTCEVSILIDPMYSGRGIGNQILSAGLRLAPTPRIIARIHAENVTSQRIFENNGFCVQSQEGLFQTWEMLPKSAELSE